MTLRLTTVERAFELAASGRCRTITEIAAALKAERFDSVPQVLQSTTMRRQLRRLMSLAADDGPPT
jgi:hypothetical protein